MNWDFILSLWSAGIAEAVIVLPLFGVGWLVTLAIERRAKRRLDRHSK